MPLPITDQIEQMHRYFAIECNNQAWELAELDHRTDEQREEMVSLAEVAAWHWSKVGTPINFTRADMLRAWVCFIVGWNDDARVYADRVHTQLESGPEGVSAWDRAFGVLLDARSSRAAGDDAAFEAISAKLDAARETLDDGERESFDQYRARIEG